MILTSTAAISLSGPTFTWSEIEPSGGWSTTPSYATGITYDSNGNYWVCGYYSPSSGGLGAWVYTDDTTPSPQFNFLNNPDTTYTTSATCIASDTSGNVYIGGTGALAQYEGAILFWEWDSATSSFVNKSCQVGEGTFSTNHRSSAYSISSSNVVVGSWDANSIANGMYPATFSPGQYNYTYTNLTSFPYSISAYGGGSFTGINSSGNAAGSYNSTAGAGPYGFAASFTFFPGSDCQTSGINSSGVVTGEYNNYAMLFASPYGSGDVTTLTADGASFGTAINDNGDIVGTCADGSGVFVYVNSTSTMYDLNTQAGLTKSTSSTYILEPTGIDNNGDVCVDLDLWVPSGRGGHFVEVPAVLVPSSSY